MRIARDCHGYIAEPLEWGTLTRAQLYAWWARAGSEWWWLRGWVLGGFGLGGMIVGGYYAGADLEAEGSVVVPASAAPSDRRRYVALALIYGAFVFALILWTEDFGRWGLKQWATAVGFGAAAAVLGPLFPMSVEWVALRLPRWGRAVLGILRFTSST